MKIKVKDLAKMLNLSSSTISLVLNNKPGISDVTRARVCQAVRDLGYEDLLITEGEGVKNILFIVYRKYGIAPSSTPYFSQLFSEIIEGVENQIKARGYNLMISYIDEKMVNEEVFKIRKENLKGILILATEMEEEQIDAFINIKIPIVILDNYMENKAINCITINNEKAVSDIIRHFSKMGHEKIGYIHASEKVNNFAERYFAYMRAMELNELMMDRRNIFKIDTSGGVGLYNEFKQIVKERTDLPTAFFADNDIVAMYAMKIFREMGYRIPEDISIIGFDNMAISELLDPPLTTIQVPKRNIGMIAANTIIDMNENGKDVMKIAVGTKLIVRESVKCLNKKEN